MASYEKEDYEAHDAMHTLLRAEEIKKDPNLMKRAQSKAKEHSRKMAEVAANAGRLAKSGHISEKQMKKLKGKVEKDQGGDPKALDKTNKIASGKEGDGGRGSPNVGAAAD
jgi:hypothetical protein